MASVSNAPNGTKRVLFCIAPKRRRTIYLGNATAELAEDVRFHVENILACRNGGPGARLNRDTSRWLESAPDDLYAKLAGVGLVESRESSAIETLEHLLKAFEAQLVVKAGTRTTYGQAMASLRNHVGGSTRLASISAATADKWRKSLNDDGLAPATIAKRVKVARAIFGKAVLWKAIDANPFAHLKSGSQANSARSFHVPREWLPALFDACPSDEWRAIIGLSRLAGLRCPSELATLQWGHVDWERRRLRVLSPKTAGHEGHDERHVPIDPDLLVILARMFEAAEPGTVPVLPRVGDGSVNLRTTFEKIVARAGLTTWPRLFHNMRASCATDWLARFTVADVAKWLGHSPAVAASHYWQARDANMDVAAGLTPKATRQTTQHRAEPVGTGAPVGAGQPAWKADSGVCQPVPSTKRTTNDPKGIRNNAGNAGDSGDSASEQRAKQRSSVSAPRGVDHDADAPDLSRAALIAKAIAALPDLTPEALARVVAIIDAPAARIARLSDPE